MEFFKKRFAKRDKMPTGSDIEKLPSECQEIIGLHNLIQQLLSMNAYIARKEYTDKIKAYTSVIEFFSVLQSSEMLAEYCKKEKMPVSVIVSTIENYRGIIELINQHNSTFIKNALIQEKNYFDNILKDVDKNITLDEDQRRAVLTDEDYCLVIAGAGAGKTTTVAAKVKFLVEKKQIEPSQILVISYTNKAVQELREKINRDLKIDCPIATFHSTGNAILNRESPERLNIVDSSRLYYVIQDYVKGSVLKNESLVNNLILFFASYFDAPYEGMELNEFFNKIAKANFATLRSDLNEYKEQILDNRTKKHVTIQNEVLRSNQEVEIANFLYLHNIEYEYEPIYRYHILMSNKPYTPDFIIKQGSKTAYIEHFGITQDGKNNRYSDQELERYKKAVKDKIALHKEHGTTLLYTFSQYSDGKGLSEHLKEELEQQGFVLHPRSNKEVMEKLISSEENRYIRKLVNLICRFITNFKTNGYSLEEFGRMYHATPNVRTRLFLNICQECYLEYEKFLKKYNAVDFEDMINESARILRETKESNRSLDFKYVIVDEYQDISRQRFDLVSAIREVCDAKVIAVGDDWQSIYAFSGSDITLFTKFAEKMGYASLLKITRTYRNSQEVIDIAGNFIQKNTTQITKELKSPKTITDPVIVYTYDSTYKEKEANNRSGVNYAIAHAIEMALEQIMEFNRVEKKTDAGEILLLGRFGFDGERLERSGLFEYINRGGKLKSVKYPKLNITFMTAHASKGLGYDNVIVVNGRNETYGFPSKIEDDPVLSLVIKGDRSIDYAEERRLFYVAMTRTKNRVYFIAPEQNPSEFLLEIKRDYKNVILKGNWNEEVQKDIWGKKYCPLCGYPLQLRYKKSFGLRLYICTNEPEICGFMTNDIAAGKLSILKCEQCRDGYLIAKQGQGKSYFLGCTNYKKDTTGCGNVISQTRFYEKMKYEPEPALPETKENKPLSLVQKCKTEYRPSIKKEVPPQRVYLNKPQTNAVIYQEYELNDVVHTILQGLVHISERKYFGTHVLADTLCGVSGKKIMDSGLNRIPEYGRLKKISNRQVIAMIYWLIENHFILQTKGQYPVLHPTYETTHYEKFMTASKLKKLRKYLEKRS